MHPQQRPYYALGLRLLAMVLLSAMLVLVKLSGERGIALAETMFWRQLLPALALAGWLAARREIFRLKTARPWVHLRRTLVGTLGMFLTLGVVQLLPLAEATILGFTTPMFAVILATVFLREKVGLWRWGAVLLGLAGVIVIAGPDREHLPLTGVAVGLGAAFVVALVSIQLRDLGRTEEPLRVVFYFSAFGAVLLSPALPLAGKPHGLLDWALIGATGVVGLFAQILMTAALRYGSVASVIVMDYSQLIWATLWGWLIFSQLPPAATLAGAPLIVAAGLVIAWRERIRGRRTSLDGTLAPNAD